MESIIMKISSTGQSEICIKYSNGTEKVKLMPIISLCRLLQSLEVSNGEPLGQMPEGYVGANYSDSKNFTVILRIPPLCCPVQFMGKLYKSIPYPELCFMLKYKTGILNESAVYAVKGENTLCYYPFGNVYEDGRICWGGYQHPCINSIKESELTARKFYELPTNNDLWKASHVNYNVGVLSNLYNLLSEKDFFPLEWLVPIGKTVQNLLD